MMRRIISVILLTIVAVSGAAGSSGTAGAGPKPDITLFGPLGNSSEGASLYFSTREEFEPNGFIRVLVKRGDGWQLAARVAEDEHLRTREVDLSTGRSAGELIIRLEPEAPGASHLDSVTVDGCAPRGLDARLARKLSAADNDVVPFSDITGAELRFAAGRKVKLAISARVEPAVLGTLPAAYPAANVHREVAAFSSFYTYRIGSRPWSPAVDGSLSTEQLNAPLFRESLPLGSGHPESPTYGWIGDDGRYLYAALDTTADNTLDPGKDYARLHLKTAAGIRTFEVTTNLVTWGRSGFEYTDRVGWEHKVYEMAIPLEEIGAVAGSDVELAFTVYGTLSTQIYWSTDPNGVDPDSGASGDTFTFTVKYSDNNVPIEAPLRHDLWIDLNGNGLEDAATPIAFPEGGAGPWVAGLIGAAGIALLAVTRRKPLARILAIATAAFSLSTCCLPTTTQEVYPMTGSGSTWSTGVVYTVEVQLVHDPDDYTFQFMFEDDAGIPVGGVASGPWTVTITE